MTEIDLRTDPFPSRIEFDRLWRVAWNAPGPAEPDVILSRSLVHLGAYADGDLVGFVNVAWDGGVHAFLLDPCVDPVHRRSGLGVRLVKEAARLAGERGAHWLHVDFEPHLVEFYSKCGFGPTAAGLMRLTPR